MGEYNDTEGIWTANLNPNEPLGLSFTQPRPIEVPAPVFAQDPNNAMYMSSQDIEQTLAANRPSSSRAYDLMRSRSSTPLPFSPQSVHTGEQLFCIC